MRILRGTPVIRSLLAAVLVMGAISAATGAATADDGRASCRAVRVPVAIPGVADRGEITGDYCVPRSANGTILLAAGGGAENASYWNMPGLERYSLVDAAAADGYATFAMDRLGTGRSTIPASSTLVTYQAIVSTTHQVVLALRHGLAGIDRQWNSVAGLGHSLGSGTVAGVAAADPADFDAIILTGYGPAVSPQTAQLNALYQVAASTVLPQYAALDSGYVTVIPKDVGVAGSFYAPATAPEALAAQAKYEGLLSKTELSTRPQGAAAESQGALITVPAFIMDGQQDRHYCENNAIDAPPSIGPDCVTQQAFLAFEQPLLSKACLATYVVANTGHALQLEQTAPATNRVLLTWLRASFSRSDGGRAHCAITGTLAS